jgi:hypothetical protein
VKSGRRRGSGSSITTRRRGWGSAVKTVYNGVLFDSKSEARYAAHLDILQDEGRITKWERQVRVRLEVNGKLICAIVVDFLVWDLKNLPTYVEIKGFETPVWRLKKRLFEALNPDATYVVVKAAEVAKL